MAEPSMMRGDVFRRMVVHGPRRDDPEPTDEAIRQLRLRYRLAANVSDAYFQAGFTVITQDIILGEHLAEMTMLIRSRPLLVVVLAPPARHKTAYGTWAANQLSDVLDAVT